MDSLLCLFGKVWYAKNVFLTFASKNTLHNELINLGQGKGQNDLRQ